ncbi:MAG: HAMP domain-containing sensor histidine kinase [Bacteroidales bacterium]
MRFEYKIGLIYLVLGLAWIYFSDTFFGKIIVDNEALIRFNIFKGAVYVFVTSFLLFFLVRSHMKKVRDAEQLTKERNEEIRRQNLAYQKMNIELEAAKDKAEESDMLKTSFLRNMSHEIRTPMNAIIGFSSLLTEQYNQPYEVKQYAGIISQRGNDLLEIIDNITEIARIESGDKIIKKDNIPAKDICHEISQIFDEYRDKYKKHSISCVFNASINFDDVFIITDKSVLVQIFRYLIDNACKFTEAGKIEVGCKQQDGNILFYVSDTGIGIPSRYKDLVFRRFQQVEDDNFRLSSGTGLGLPIAKALVEMLGGTIWFESESGEGTVFYFTVNEAH